MAVELDVSRFNTGSLISQPAGLLRPGANAKALLRSFRSRPFSRQPCHAAFSRLSLKARHISSFSSKNKEVSQKGLLGLLVNLPAQPFR